jgi:hypothetical protein
MLRAAGLSPVRTIHGSFRQRYAIAAIATTAATDAPTMPDPLGAGE